MDNLLQENDSSSLATITHHQQLSWGWSLVSPLPIHAAMVTGLNLDLAWTRLSQEFYTLREKGWCCTPEIVYMCIERASYRAQVENGYWDARLQIWTNNGWDWTFDSTSQSQKGARKEANRPRSRPSLCLEPGRMSVCMKFYEAGYPDVEPYSLGAAVVVAE